MKKRYVISTIKRCRGRRFRGEGE